MGQGIVLRFHPIPAKTKVSALFAADNGGRPARLLRQIRFGARSEAVARKSVPPRALSACSARSLLRDPGRGFLVDVLKSTMMR